MDYLHTLRRLLSSRLRKQRGYPSRRECLDTSAHSAHHTVHLIIYYSQYWLYCLNTFALSLNLSVPRHGR